MNAIQISNVAIRQNDNQFYNLNDLHKASGGCEKYKPSNWLRLQQAQELIAEIEAEGGKACEVIHGGKNRGTFVCKELVYAYATWISAKFFLLVIRTFDAIVSGNLNINKPTKDDRTGLRQAITALVGKFDISHSEAYKLVHHRFNVASIEDLNHEQVVQAVEYVHRLILDGELLDKEPEQPKIPEYDYGMARLFVKYGAGVAQVDDLYMALYQLSHIQNTFLKMLEHKALHFPMNQAEQKCVDILAHWQMVIANVGCKL